MLKEKITNLILNNRVAGKAAIVALNTKNYGGQKYMEECERRKKLELWDYQELSAEMQPHYADLSPNSSYYGIMHQIKKYVGMEGFCYWNVEHGLFLGEYVESESFGKAMKGTITFSDKRREYLEKRIKSKVVTIGPYIHYAEAYYTEEKFREVKAKMGRVLLAFPPHSTRTSQATYDTEMFIKKLREMGKEYDTVMVCMFFKDIQSGAYKPYEDEGFKIVTSGHMFDSNFLSRQKEIIRLSDFTVSASVGTHIGYCLYLGKEHMILSLSEDGGIGGNINERIDVRKEGVDAPNIKFDSYHTDEELLLKLFLDHGKKESAKQREVVSSLWGFDCVKQADELRRLLQ